MEGEIGQWYADTTKGLALPSQAKGSPREATVLDTTLLQLVRLSGYRILFVCKAGCVG